MPSNGNAVRMNAMLKMYDLLDEMQKKKERANDPSTAAADSVAVSKERVVRGTATGADSTRLMMEGVPGFKLQETPKLSDYGQALARIRAGKGDKADSIHVGLKPRASGPRMPSYSIREGVDPDTGRPVFLRSNSLTGNIEPVKTGYAPSAGKKDEDEDPDALRKREKGILSDLADVENDLNYASKNSPEYVKTLVDLRATLQNELSDVREKQDALKSPAYRQVKERAESLKQSSATLGADVAQVADRFEKNHPAAENRGKAFLDEDTGIILISNGKQYIPAKLKGQ